MQVAPSHASFRSDSLLRSTTVTFTRSRCRASMRSRAVPGRMKAGTRASRFCSSRAILPPRLPVAPTKMTFESDMSRLSREPSFEAPRAVTPLHVHSATISVGA